MKFALASVKMTPDQPTKLDVLCGRGKVSVNHSGNVCLRTLLGYYCLDQYSVLLAQSEKSKFIADIVSTIQNHGGKFLKWNKGKRLWEPIDDRAAKRKVGNLLRDAPRLKDFSLVNPFDFPSSSYRSEREFDWATIAMQDFQTMMMNVEKKQQMESKDEGATSVAKNPSTLALSIPSVRGNEDPKEAIPTGLHSLYDTNEHLPPSKVSLFYSGPSNIINDASFPPNNGHSKSTLHCSILPWPDDARHEFHWFSCIEGAQRYNNEVVNDSYNPAHDVLLEKPMHPTDSCSLSFDGASLDWFEKNTDDDHLNYNRTTPYTT